VAAPNGPESPAFQNNFQILAFPVVHLRHRGFHLLVVYQKFSRGLYLLPLPRIGRYLDRPDEPQWRSLCTRLPEIAGIAPDICSTLSFCKRPTDEPIVD
jgi:hypothetical protein